MKKLWKVLKVAMWSGLGLALMAVTIQVTRFSWRLWQEFPPSTASEAWAALDALGGVLGGLGGLWVGAIALRGLRSLYLTRVEMIHRADRERKLSAIHQLEEVASTLVGMNTPILDGMVAEEIKPFLKSGDRIQFDSPPPQHELTAAATWANAIPGPLYGQIVQFLNHLEAWSVYFTTGVADEEVAFEPMAPLLRSWVGQYYPMLILLRSAPGSGPYPNLVKLFSLWSAKMDAAQLARTFGDMTDQYERAMKRVEQNKLPISEPNLDG